MCTELFMLRLEEILRKDFNNNVQKLERETGIPKAKIYCLRRNFNIGKGFTLRTVLDIAGALDMIPIQFYFDERLRNRVFLGTAENYVGDVLRENRESRGLSRERLSQELNREVDPNLIYSYETGNGVQLDKLHLFADYFGLYYRYLVPKVNKE